MVFLLAEHGPNCPFWHQKKTHQQLSPKSSGESRNGVLRGLHGLYPHGKINFDEKSFFILEKNHFEKNNIFSKIKKIQKCQQKNPKISGIFLLKMWKFFRFFLLKFLKFFDFRKNIIFFKIIFLHDEKRFFIKIYFSVRVQPMEPT